MPDLMNREIFAAGTHNGETYTERDLDDMVEAFASLDFQPALKQGHVQDETGLPALGYVSNLRRVGKKLVADFTDMPEHVYEAIQSKRFARVSAEIFHNFRRAGKNFRRVLKAVALLGVEIPAVAGLKPLHVFESGEFETLETVEINFSEVDKMADDAVTKELEALKKRLDAAEQANLALAEEKEKADARVAVFADEVKALRSENIKAKVAQKVAGLNVPALKDHFVSLYSLALEDSKQVNFKDGESSLEELVDSLFAEINKKAESVFAEQGETQETKKALDSGDPIADFDAKVKAYVAEKGCSYRDGLNAVKNLEPEAFKAYAAAQQTH